MNSAWVIRTGRLVLTPVAWPDLSDLTALKADPSVYAQMLGGVRNPAQVRDELAAEQAFWAAHGVGMWAARLGRDRPGWEHPGRESLPQQMMDGGALLGTTGLHERPDGLGMALRFAFRPEMRGQGLAREAAGAALRFAHDRAGMARVVAVTREANIASRTVLGAVGMRECGEFFRGSERMLVYESLRSVGS